MIFYTKTKNLDKKLIFNRSGLIFYSVENGEIYFIFGIDTKHSELTDLGGGTEDNENFLQTATREAHEESLGILDYRGKEDYVHEHSYCAYDKYMIILFLKIQSKKETVISEYNKRHLEILFYKGKYSENTSLIYIDSHDLTKIVNIDKIFYYGCNFFNLTDLCSSNVFLPDYLSVMLSCVYNCDIKKYPVMYERIRNLLKPVLKNIIYDLNLKI